MKVHTFKSYLTPIALACLIPAVNAQFDDVYYDPDDVEIELAYSGSSQDDNYDSGVTYYDDDEYEYYDDYDYYYSSRIRRFHRPYAGFGYYDPCYVNFNYYDPYYYDAYYYPGASIYISFGNYDYWSYRQWRRWNRWRHWNNYYGWNSWCMSPSYYYYSYNSWYSPNHHYWGGYHNYYSYSNYYNNYYNSCPFPVSTYYGINHNTVTNVNNGNSRGVYYGPRIAGNTGSSPRGPVTKPENVQPVFRENDKIATDPTNGVTPTPGVRNNPADVDNGKILKGAPVTRDNGAENVIVDKELDKDKEPRTIGQVFRPYPTNENDPAPSTSDRISRDNATPSSGGQNTEPTREKPTYQPSPRSTERPDVRPSPSDEKRPENPVYTPRRTDDKPSYTPRNEERPNYRPPSRSSEKNDELPRYTPPSRNEDRQNYDPPSRRNDDRPSYNPPSRNEDRPSYNPPSRGSGNDRPSYSPPSRSESSGGGRSSSASPSRDNSSSGSSKGNSSGSSPRSRGN